MADTDIVVSSSAPLGTIYAGPVGTGVALNPPPTFLLPSIGAAIDKAVAGIPSGKNGALVGIVTPVGANLAIVHRIGESFAVTAWIGRSWGPKVDGQNPFDYGAECRMTW